MPDEKQKIAGFTIVELLVALAITVMLVLAAGTAFNASTKNYQQNRDIFKAVNNARQALYRVTTQLRTGLVDPCDVASPNRCKFITADGSEITYRYDSATNELYLHDNDTGSDYLLCDNVTAMTFNKDNSTPTGDVKSVQISMTVQVGEVNRKVSAATVIRRVLE